jgi:hypothetical protein
MDWFDVVPFRWVHITSACLLVGATFFYAVVTTIEPTEGTGEGTTLSRARRSLRMLVRVTIVLLIATGIFNFLLKSHVYHWSAPLSHALFGSHVLLALGVVALLEAGLSIRRADRPRRRLVWAAVLLAFAALAAASSLRYARERSTPLIFDIQKVSSGIRYGRTSWSSETLGFAGLDQLREPGFPVARASRPCRESVKSVERRHRRSETQSARARRPCHRETPS